jgi:signal transduction histidine kinase
MPKDKPSLSDLVSSVPGVIWEIPGDPSDSTIHLRYINKYGIAFLGYTYKQWYNTPGFWLQIVHPDDIKRVRKELRQIYLGKKDRTLRYRWTKKKGMPVWVRSWLRIIRDDNDKPIGVRIISTDISTYMKAEFRKDEFISMASHELKTPLTSIKAYVQLLKRHQGLANDSEGQAYLDRMNAQVDRLNDLVSRMLDTTRIYAGKLAIHRTRFALDELIREVVQDVKNLNQTHVIQTPRLLPVFVTADRARIIQVLTNLLSNAIKYSPVGSPIIVRISRDPNQITVRVKDYGKGISKENQKHIFERFFQATNRSKTDAHDQSLGLGLYIAAEIIKHHDGSIKVQSKKGQGSTFSFSLPNEDKV